MIRVSDAGDAVSHDESVEFKIRPVITVVTPSAGDEIWPVESKQTVSWTTVGNLANVKLEYSTNGFADETQTTTIGTVVNLGATGDCTRPTGGGYRTSKGRSDARDSHRCACGSGDSGNAQARPVHTDAVAYFEIFDDYFRGKRFC